MNHILTVLQIVAPIFTAAGLGVLARRRQMLTPEEVRGLQQFAVKFGLPCVVFNACLTAKIGSEALVTMVLAIIPLLIATLWTFRFGRKWLGYDILPMFFSCRETGMLGIPLTITLFGAAESYRMGVLDLAQAFVVFPVIAILTSNTGRNPTVGQVLKSVLLSPLMIMSVLGLGLNLSGAAAWMDRAGIGPILTEATGFLSQPVSALMLFSVGYNFSLDKDSRRDIFRIAGIILGWFALVVLISQWVLSRIPGVDDITRWVMLLYFLLPTSYLSPGLSRTQKDATLSAGLCSLLTVFTLILFCVISAFVA